MIRTGALRNLKKKNKMEQRGPGSIKLFLMALLLCCLPLSAAVFPNTSEPLRVYYIGNSLTACPRLERLFNFYAQKGIPYEFGSQGSAAKTLLNHWNYKNDKKSNWVAYEANCPDGKGGWKPCVEPFKDPNPKRFGLYDKALTEHTWDVLVLQPYMSPLQDNLKASINFIELALKKSPKAKFYINATWPRKTPGVETVDFEKQWLGLKPYGMSPETKYWSSAYTNREYYQKLCNSLNDKLKERIHQPILMIPGGEVLFELDRAIKAGTLPGLEALYTRSPKHLPGAKGAFKASEGVDLLYADGIHLNPLPHTFPAFGAFAVSMTMFSAVSGTSPVGLSGAVYELDDKLDAKLIAATQELVWKVVKEYSRIENLK